MSGRSANAKRAAKAEAKRSQSSGQFTKTLVSVLGVQVITLALLWFLQSHFTG